MTVLDEHATIQNVKEVLTHYQMFKNMAKWLELTNTIPTIENLPKYIDIEQPLSRIDALQLKLNCDNVIQNMSGDECHLLKLRYVEYGHSDDYVMRELELSKSTYTRHKNSACLSFAKLFGLIELQVYKPVLV